MVYRPLMVAKKKAFPQCYSHPKVLLTNHNTVNPMTFLGGLTHRGWVRNYWQDVADPKAAVLESLPQHGQ